MWQAIRSVLQWVGRPFLEHEIEYVRHFNTPVKFFDDRWYVNERLVERAFVLSHLDTDAEDQRVLDFGCTKSDLTLMMASLGLDVTAVDLREYAFDHPNLTFHRCDVRDLEADPFDTIVAVSTFEHVGLGAYDEPPDDEALAEVADRLQELLAPGGDLLLTVPFGQPYADEFLRSFTWDEITTLFGDLKLDATRFARREDLRYWQPCTREEAAAVSNTDEATGPTGVNAVGCFRFLRPD